MKIHRVVQMLGATTSTGKLADDMYDLGHKDYYSEAQDKVIPISHMDFQHLVRAFVKQNEEDVRTDTQEGKIRDQAKFYDDVVEKNNRIYKKNLEETISTYNTYLANSMPLESFKKINNQCEELTKEVAHWKKLAEDNFISSVNDSEDKDTWKKKYDDLKKKSEYDGLNVEGVRTMWEARYENEVNNSEFWKKAYMDYDKQPKGCGYVFSEIPNDTDGQEFVDNMKKYFNKKTYKMRVRGQHIKPELKGTGATAYGQSRDESTHLRVYIDVK